MPRMNTEFKRVWTSKRSGFASHYTLTVSFPLWNSDCQRVQELSSYCLICICAGQIYRTISCWCEYTHNPLLKRANRNELCTFSGNRLIALEFPHVIGDMRVTVGWILSVIYRERLALSLFICPSFRSFLVGFLLCGCGSISFFVHVSPVSFTLEFPDALGGSFYCSRYY